MKSMVFLVLCLLSGNLLYGQAPYTLGECIQQALHANVDIKRQQVKLDKQAIRVETEKYSRLPDLNLNGTQQFDFGRSLNRDNTYTDVNSQTSSFSLTTEVGLFSGFKTMHSIARQKLELKINRELLEKVRNDITLQVTICYYQILLDKEIAAIADEQIILTREQEEMTRVLVTHGKVAESQVLTVKAQLANDELASVKAANTLRLSMINLLQLLELRDTAGFDIVPVALDTLMPLAVSPDEIFAVSEQIMPEIKSARTAVESSRSAIRIAKAGYYPSLALAAKISSGYYHNNDNNPPLDIQFKNNMQQTVYLTLRIPLFNRMTTRNALRTAQKEQEDSRLAADNALKTLYKEIQKTWYDALSAYERYESTRHSVAANSEALRYAKEKYQAGKSTVYEYNEAKMKLANSRSEQAQARYEFALRKKILDFYADQSIR